MDTKFATQLAVRDGTCLGWPSRRPQRCATAPDAHPHWRRGGAFVAQGNRRDLASPWELLTGKTCPMNVRRLRYMWTGISPTSGLGPRELAINGTGEPRDARHDRRRGASFLQTQ